TQPLETISSLAMLLLTTIVGIYCVWLLLTEFTRSRVIRLPIDRQAAATAAKQRQNATWAARLGIVRGDLWAESGYTFADLLWTNSGSKADTQSLDLARGRLYKA